MNEDDKSLIILIGIAAVTVISIAVLITYYNVVVQKAAFEHGYQKVQMFGTRDTEYQKVK